MVAVLVHLGRDYPVFLDRAREVGLARKGDRSSRAGQALELG